MKQLLVLTLCALLALSCCACGQDIGVIGSADGPTTVIVGQQNQNLSDPQPETPPVPGEATPPAEPDAPALPTVSGEQDSYNLTWGEMQSSDFWIALAEDPQAVRMTPEEIADYNRSLSSVQGAKVEKLQAWPSVLSHMELSDLLDYYGEAPSASYYTPDGRINADVRLEMSLNRNEAAVANQNPVKYGFLTENLIMRTFPSPVPLYDSPDAWEYDKAAETALKLWEPVLVLHTSVDGNWLLVQAYDYLGWVETEKVALCEREQWDALRAQLQADYLTVLAPRLVLDGSFHHPGQEHIVLKMGTVLPLTDDKEADNAISDNCYIVRLPRRLEDGSLETYTARIPQNEDVTMGSLPFTTENLLRQVFKLLGHRYGWGGTAEGWDCSSICQDAYRTVGLFLPRNSGNQRRIPDCHNVENASLDQKRALLDTLQPGAMLELPGHQTMYIGAFEGDHYVIHATHGVYDSNMDFYNANSVIVSSVQALRSNGKSLLQNFRGFSMPVAD